MKKLLLSVFALIAGTGAYAQWTEQYTGFTTPYRGIDEINIVTPDIVWCTATDGMTGDPVLEYTHTEDGGTNWSSGVIDLDVPGQKISNIIGIDGQTAFVGAFNEDNGLGGVYRTSDGGTNWENMNSAAYQAEGAWFNFVYFWDSMNGITQGDPVATDFEIYLTTDGGDSWTPVNGSAIPNPVAGNEWGYTGGYASAGNTLWFTTSKGNLYRTSDYGATWVKKSTPISDFGSAGINGRVFFSDVNGNGIGINGCLISTINNGTSYKLYRTTNGGDTWDAGVTYTQPYKYNLSYIPGTTTLVGTGVSGTSPNLTYHTGISHDNGLTWTELDTEQRTSIDFINASTGWTGNFVDETGTTGGIYKYTGTALAIPTVPERPQFSVSPNPTSGIVQIGNDNAAIADVTVFDLLGKQVFNKKYSAVNQTNVDLSSLTTGSYIMKVTAETGASQTIKIMKN